MKRLLLWLIAAFVPAAIGAPFPAPDYYRRLNKPSWAPPPRIFGPVWTALYAMIGTSAWLVARRGGGGTRAALGLWWAQLALNAAWTPIFFGARNRGLALVEILVTWVVIVATTVAFFTRRTAAGLLLLPYLAWVTFASALSYAVWRDN
jgi:tryptophan-rich sensory protein